MTIQTILCPCATKARTNIEFDPGETSRRVPCNACYGENHGISLDPEIVQRWGKVLKLNLDGTSEVLEDFGCL